MDLYLFDFDKTLYAYDSSKRLPAQARLGSVSQYHLAKTWWAAGFEREAESGRWPTASEYLDEFARVTGARLTLDQWIEARRAASTPLPGMIDQLRHAATLGTVSLLSNNPSPFGEALPIMAPDVADVLGDNVLVSYRLGVRKPSPEIYRLALDAYGADARDTFFVDDSLSNVEAAASIGITTHHFTGDRDNAVSLTQAIAAVGEAIDRFSSRTS